MSLNDHLANKEGMDKQKRAALGSLVFGKDGLVVADDSLVFDQRLGSFQLTSIPALVREHVSKPQRTELDTQTMKNNDCEAIAHVLKVITNFEPQNLVDLVSKIETYVKGRMKFRCGAGIYWSRW